MSKIYWKNEYDLLLKKDFIGEDKGKENWFQKDEYEVYFTHDRLEKGPLRKRLEVVTSTNSPQTGWCAYHRGAGKELEEVDGKPAKFLSIASSSNFCFTYIQSETEGAHYLAKVITDGEEAEQYCFEKKLPILNGRISPHLDAYIETKSTDIYVECKCHEFCSKIESNDSKENTFLLSQSYWNQYQDSDGLPSYIDQFLQRHKDKLPTNCKEAKTKVDKDGERKFYAIKFDIFQDRLSGRKENDPVRFDAKQFFTHLMGIIKNRNDKNRNAVLTYCYCIPASLWRKEKRQIDDQTPLGSVVNKAIEDAKTIFLSKFVQSYCRKENIQLRFFLKIDDHTEEPASEKNTHEVKEVTKCYPSER